MMGNTQTAPACRIKRVGLKLDKDVIKNIRIPYAVWSSMYTSSYTPENLTAGP